MLRPLLTLAAGLVAAIGVSSAPAPKTEPIKFVSLKGHTNVKMDENLHSDRFPNNNLSSLPTGKQKFAFREGCYGSTGARTIRSS